MRKSDAITVRLIGKEDKDVSFDSFLRVVNAVRGILKELDPGEVLDWTVKEAAKNSPLVLTFECPITSPSDSQIVDNYVSVFNQTSSRSLSKNIRNFRSAIINTVTNDGVSRVCFESPGRQTVNVWPKRQSDERQTDQLTPSNEYVCRVELTGMLEIASSEHSDTVFFVRDRVNHRKVKCEVTREIFNEALEAMKLPSPRIAVMGRTTYRDDRPVKMRVETFRVMPTIGDHPGFFAVQGINLTDGVDSVTYVRSIRDGD